MSGAVLRSENPRCSLSEAILAELKSWPDLHRQIFVQSHYRGQSLEQASRCFGLQVSEVRTILRQCERKLSAALRAFRGLSLESDLTSDMRMPANSHSGYLH